MTDVRERVVGIITEVLGLDPSEAADLAKETGSEPLAKWDSMRHVELIVALEDAFGIEIEERAIPKLNSVARIVEHLRTKLTGAR
jgi:acyl carrier protein